ncbi:MULTISPECIES: Uma2 family endonuclease [unclassified Streptomyces]|uniref:Uma2 family endonuclease n=1 Tax=unclassified Streptomyces TaxID=2593676 RepID=UPI0035E196A9
MPLHAQGDDFPDHVVPGHEGVSVEQTFELFSAVAPRGWRVELTEGEITVVPPANGEHEEIVSELSGQVRDHDRGLGRYTGIGLRLPDGSKVIPDLVVAPKGSYSDQQEWHAPAAVLLVAEVTSASTAGRDRVQKIRGYARAGIPLYLLIDRDADVAVLCHGPSGDAYDHKVTHKLGTAVPLPAPFGFDLDTSEF